MAQTRALLSAEIEQELLAALEATPADELGGLISSADYAAVLDELGQIGRAHV